MRPWASDAVDWQKLGSKFLKNRCKVSFEFILGGNKQTCSALKWKSSSVCFQINHKYYESQVFRDGQKYWRDIEKDPSIVLRTDLSDHYLTKAVLWTIKFLRIRINTVDLVSKELSVCNHVTGKCYEWFGMY